MNDLAKNMYSLPRGVPALSKEKCLDLIKNLDGWSLNEEASRLRKSFKFDDFDKAIGLAVLIGKMAMNNGITLSFMWVLAQS